MVTSLLYLSVPDTFLPQVLCTGCFFPFLNTLPLSPHPLSHLLQVCSYITFSVRLTLTILFSTKSVSLLHTPNSYYLALPIPTPQNLPFTLKIIYLGLNVYHLFSLL